jgi:multidrug efflux pump subunit AcrA (membrane-fusion protein)
MTKKSNNPGMESLIFRPAKVSWAINSYLMQNNARFERYFILSFLLVAGAFLGWAWNTTKAIVIDVPGELVTKTPPLPVSLSYSVKIKKILVANNQRVKKGDVLLHLNTFISAEQISEIQKTFFKLKENVDAEKRQSCPDSCELQLRLLAERGFPFLDKIDTGSDFYRELHDLSRQLKDYQTQLNYRAQLPATTASIKNEMANAQKKLKTIIASKAQKILAYEMEELKNKVIHLQAQYQEKVLSVQSSLEAARNALEVSIAKMPKSLTNYTANSTVVSPADGLLSFAELKGEGQLINPGQPLFFLNSSTSQLKIHLKIPNTDISKIRPEMPVRLDVSSYPAAEYGVQEGTISEIPEKLNFKNERQDNHFDVYAELKEPHVLFRGKIYPYRSGMTAKAKVILKHEKVLTYYYKKLLSIKDEVLGE